MTPNKDSLAAGLTWEDSLTAECVAELRQLYTEKKNLAERYGGLTCSFLELIAVMAALPTYYNRGLAFYTLTAPLRGHSINSTESTPL